MLHMSLPYPALSCGDPFRGYVIVYPPHPVQTPSGQITPQYEAVISTSCYRTIAAYISEPIVGRTCTLFRTHLSGLFVTPCNSLVHCLLSIEDTLPVSSSAFGQPSQQASTDKSNKMPQQVP